MNLFLFFIFKSSSPPQVQGSSTNSFSLNLFSPLISDFSDNLLTSIITIIISRTYCKIHSNFFQQFTFITSYRPLFLFQMFKKNTLRYSQLDVKNRLAWSRNKTKQRYRKKVNGEFQTRELINRLVAI